MKLIFASVVAGLFACAPVVAQERSARTTFADAFALLESGDREQANRLLADAPAFERDLLAWTTLRDRETEADLQTYVAFLQRRPDWPGNDRIRAAAERAMDQSVPAGDVLAFFENKPVQTGQGAVVLAKALIAQGRRADAEAMLIEFWRTETLSTAEHRAIINAFAQVVEPHHTARADMLLWRWRTSDVADILPLLEEGRQALVRARIALITRANDAAKRESLIPDRLKDDPGLHYDRFNRLAARGDWTDATEILRARSSSAETLGVAWRWGSWRRILARWHMREGNVDLAYTLAANHFIAPDETNYADLEWLAGYIALTYRNDAARAVQHFTRFDAAVSSPISKGRAGYWRGRAFEAADDSAAAIASYRAGAQHQTSFYGLLSAEKLGLTLNPDLVGGEDFGDPRAGTVLKNDKVRAALAWLDAGERGLAVLFFADVASELNRQEIGQLGTLLMQMDEPFYTVLIAKAAVRADLLVQDVYFPLHPLGDLDLPVEPALSLAIARQESEFRNDAGSSVGALGIMQLMPATAEEVAGWLDLPFSRARLTSDWTYNATLGSEYLAYLTREFGDSPVMIAAGYNAGPSRPRSWMDERGDPRAGFANPDPVDVIDWIEHIPFRETRNYVMRVTEGIPVYRARLSGTIAPVRFTDLLVGARPMIRPPVRPGPPGAVPEITEVTPAVTLSAPLPSQPAPVTTLRPQMRPGVAQDASALLRPVARTTN